MSKKYNIVRYYQRRDLDPVVIHRDFTRDEATRHCNDKETSSSTCTNPLLVAHTKSHGPWFDGFVEV